MASILNLNSHFNIFASKLPTLLQTDYYHTQCPLVWTPQYDCLYYV